MAVRLTNELVARLLMNLGFEQGRVTERNQRVWLHPESGCLGLLPANKAQEVPRPADLVGLKDQLELYGLMDEQDFDYFAAAGSLPVRSVASH
jgi:hypothetical protein